MLRTDPGYRKARAGAADGHACTGAWQEAGYATDPHYARKVQAVLDGSTLRDALAALKADGARPLT